MGLYNKHPIYYFIPALIIGMLFGGSFVYFTFPTTLTSVDTVFSPDNGYEILGLIESAEESLFVEVYILSSEEIIQKLIDAKNRGVDVRIILEKRLGGNNEEVYDQLKLAGVDVRWASFDYKLTHSKILIVDKKRVFVGSQNFSDSAMYKNREVSVILEGEEIVNRFLALFYEDWLKAGLP